MSEGNHTYKGSKTAGMRKGTERLARKGDINGGLTEAQRVAVTKWEDKHRDMKTERVVAFDSNGNVVNKSTKGTSTRTYLGYIPPNCVITHNHPTSVKGIQQVTDMGVSFSHSDIRATVRKNALEVRAVAGKYTYSLRRPKNGWNCDPDKVYSEYTSIYNKHLDTLSKHRDKINPRTDSNSFKTYMTRHQRMNTLACHLATREIAAK